MVQTRAEKLVAEKRWREAHPGKVAEYSRRYREKHPDREKAKAKRSREKNKEQRRAYNKKYQAALDPMIKYERPARRFVFAGFAARHRGYDWSLTLDQYLRIIEDPCHYCAYELGSRVTRGSGLDRLDNSRGYELANVVSCCKICNAIKNSFLTPEETRVAVQAVLALRQRGRLLRGKDA